MFAMNVMWTCDDRRAAMMRCTAAAGCACPMA